MSQDKPFLSQALSMRVIQSYFSLVLLIFAALFLLDHTMGQAPAKPPAQEQKAAALAPSSLPAHEGDGRVFVLIIDSLRYQTSIDPQMMPYFVHMRQNATFSKMQTVVDAVTLPAFRSAFTGQTVFQVLNFLRIFSKEQQGGLASIFTQMTKHKKRAAVFSDPWSFAQFAHDIGTLKMIKGSELAAVRQVVSLYQKKQHELVVLHMHMLDRIAHRRGVYHPDYMTVARTLDQVIRFWDGLIPKNSNYLVIGDHGHTETGAHALGQDVPTYLLARGPAFAKGQDLSHVHISSFRYFLSWALKLPLSSEYQGPAYPKALVSKAPIPKAYLANPKQHDKEGEHSRRRALWILACLACFLGLYGLLWWQTTNGPVPLELASTAVLWGAPCCLFATSWSPWNVVLGVVLLAAWLLVQGWMAGRFSRMIALVVGMMLVGLACLGWGYLLGVQHTRAYYPTFTSLRMFWGVALFLFFLLGMWWESHKVAWIFLAIPGFFFYHSTIHYGFVWSLVPVWSLVCALLLGHQLLRWREERTKLLISFAYVVGIFFLIQPYFAGDTTSFVVYSYASWWEGLASLFSWQKPVVLGLCVLLIYFDAQHRWVGRIAAVAIAAVHFALVMWGELGAWHGVVGVVGVGVAVLAVLIRVGILHKEPQQRVAWSVLLGLWACFLLSRYSLKLPLYMFQDATIFFAALVLTSRWMRSLEMPLQVRRAYYLMFLVLGLLIGGIVTLQWSFFRLEWSYLFSFFTVEKAYEYPLLIVPMIILRYALPVVSIRLLLRREWSDISIEPGREVLLLLGAKCIHILAVALGLSLSFFRSLLFLECIQHIAIFLVLGAGWLLWNRGGWGTDGVEESMVRADGTDDSQPRVDGPEGTQSTSVESAVAPS